MNTTEHRLSRHVVPSAYDITLDASPKRASFHGHLTLTARVKRDQVKSFEMHARGLNVTNVKALVDNKRLTATIETVRKHELIILTFKKPLPRGKITVSMDFKGKLNPSMHGLYFAKDGADKAIVSQCEAADARAIFPCFDEPEFKATLAWTIKTDPGLQVITNGVLESQTRSRTSPIREIHHFKPTRVVPTYLAAVTIGRFESSPTQRVAKIPCRILAGVGKVEQTVFAQEVTAQVLPWYEDYFAHRYNYQKLDQVAVPGFDAGAMENIGAIFYRQSLLLMQPETTSWQAQKRIAEVIAHEIAHQWFGNLVTMKWWDDLWLNEAFATWIAYKTIDLWQPKWRIWDDYLESKESALGADALTSTHPIYTPVRSPAEATELFDIITYEKGCAVLRMAESYLGDKAFRKGIQLYIERFKNKNAAGADLWNSLTKASKVPVDDLMQSWINQSGFPLVGVFAAYRNNKLTIHLSQRRFFASAERFSEPCEQLWDIPIIIAYHDGESIKSHRLLLTQREITVELPATQGDWWVYPNDNATGFYRMHFHDDALRRVLEFGLKHLSPAARMTFIEDQWALVRNGSSNIGRFMDVLTAFRKDTDHIVVRAIVARLRTLHQQLVAQEDRQAFQSYTQWLLQHHLESCGWAAKANELPPQAVLRAAVIGALGEVGRDEGVLRQAEALVDDEMDDPKSVEANLASVLIALGAIRGDHKQLKRYVDTYLTRKEEQAAPELQSRYLSALACFEDEAIVRKVLKLCIDETVPQEQLRSVLVPMLSRRATQLATWDFIKKHWKDIGPRVGSMGIARLVEATGALPAHLRSEVIRFFDENPVEEAQRALQKALEAMELHQVLVERESAGLSKWLGHRSKIQAAG
ncbi:MAG: M1 family aminopeptidase [Myxococcota bacterium]